MRIGINCGHTVSGEALFLIKSICSGNSPEIPRFLSNITSLKMTVDGGKL